MNNSLWHGRSLSFFLVAALSILLWTTAETSALAQRRAAPRTAAADDAVTYECPMHSEVTSKTRGKCPKCGMTLVARSKNTPEAATAGETARSATEKPAETGLTNLRIPDAAVVDQNGRKLNFYTDLVKGKTVIINFIFTTCTTICPPLTATFRKVQQDLGDHAGRDVQLISISVDPTTDVPERLKEFSAQFKAGPGWTFVTGSKPEIDSLLKALGAFVADKNDHTPMILIGNDAANYWTRSYGLAPASTLIKTIVEALARSVDNSSSASGPADSTGTNPASVGSVKTDSNASPSANYFPNLVLITQDNRPVHFYDDLLKGKVVLINFIFTTCQGVCSPMTANLARVQNYLAEHLGKEVVMISISVDPLTDTPERLKKYADSFKVKPGWYFLTGEKKNVDWVLYKLGGFVEDKQQHSTVLIIGNEATGEWVKVIAMSNPTEIASAVTKLLGSKPE
jgi:cytochrome oxidase Cu insertion factor (SCO1/SenC/PrrC family)